MAVQRPDQLYRNLGNDNAWLEIDLVGAVSNPHGIGARVYLTAGGITQLREQNAGMHRNTQDHMRIHFGMGANSIAQQIVIEWPSGTTQVLDNVSADQILTVIEPGGG